MIIFAEGLEWFDFWKMIIFKSILVSFWSPFFENEIENKNKNELKMDEKGQLWTTLVLLNPQ